MRPMPESSGRLFGLYIQVDRRFSNRNRLMKNQPNNQPVKVALDDYKPTVPNTDDLLKTIDNNLQLLRIQGQNH
jgi:hypothetical protein